MRKNILTIASAVALGAFAVAGSVYAAAGDATDADTAQVKVEGITNMGGLDLVQAVEVTAADISTGSTGDITLGTFCVYSNVRNADNNHHFSVQVSNGTGGSDNDGNFLAEGVAGTGTASATLAYTLKVNDETVGSSTSGVGSATDIVKTTASESGDLAATTCTGKEETISVKFTGLTTENTKAGLYTISLTLTPVLPTGAPTMSQ